MTDELKHVVEENVVETHTPYSCKWMIVMGKVLESFKTFLVVL